MINALEFNIEEEQPVDLKLDFQGEIIRGDGEAAYQQGYQDGYKEGYKIGKQEGLAEGYEKGWSEGNIIGEADGYEKGYNNGYEQGLLDGQKEEQEKFVTITKNGTTEILPDANKVLSKVTVDVNVPDNYYDTFWDGCQQNGERVSYNYGFAHYSWNDITFKPKYDIRPTSAQYIFSNTAITDLAKLLDDAGVVLDTSQVPNLIGAFASTNLTHIPTISLENCTGNATTSMLFYISRYLVTIDKIIINRDTNIFSNAFFGLNALENIIFEGKIGMSISLAQSSKLSTVSVQSIIDALGDFTGETAPVLALHKDVKAKLTDVQIATVTNKNWTLA